MFNLVYFLLRNISHIITNQIDLIKKCVTLVYNELYICMLSAGNEKELD